MTGRKKELIKYEIHGRIVECEPDETLKYEVADELGLLELAELSAEYVRMKIITSPMQSIYNRLLLHVSS